MRCGRCNKNEASSKCCNELCGKCCSGCKLKKHKRTAKPGARPAPYMEASGNCASPKKQKMMADATSATSACDWCNNPATTRCSGCQRVSYCSRDCQARDWKEGKHKVLCKDLPKAISTAEALVESSNPPPNKTDAFGTVCSPEENRAQDYCYDAMEVCDRPGCTLADEVKQIIKALRVFPLSTEAWGMLGAFYRYDLPDDQRDYEQSLRMYKIAIRSARKLNPTWTDDRRERLEWGLMETRPYLRAVMGRAFALKGLGRTDEAIKDAKKLLKWNPNDNQGARQVLCSWLLEVGDTEGCLNLLRDYDEIDDANLAYSNVLLQFLRWRKDEVFEEVVQKALCEALYHNLFVPDFLMQEDELEEEEREYIDPGGPSEARSYAEDAQCVWRAHPGALEWLASQKNSQGVPKPADSELVRLLKSEMNVLVKCKHTALDGSDPKTTALYATRRRENCVGNVLDGFTWPSALDLEYVSGSPILMHRNDLFDDCSRDEDRWRKADYENITEVPFWKVMLKGDKEGWIKE